MMHLRPYRQILYSLMVLVLISTVTCQISSAQTSGGEPVTTQPLGIIKYRGFSADTIRGTILRTVIVSSSANFEVGINLSDLAAVNMDTLFAWISYKNVGNAKADSAKVKGFLVTPGLRIPVIPIGAIKSGDTLIWTLRDFPVGKKDSVRLPVVIDTTGLSSGLGVNADRQLNVGALLEWGNRSTNIIQQPIILTTFARLALFTNPWAPTILKLGSGRDTVYQFLAMNTGNVPALNVIITDSISGSAEFAGNIDSTMTVSPNRKVITWRMGDLAPNAPIHIDVRVRAHPNLRRDSLSMKVTLRADNVAEQKDVSTKTEIISVDPATADLTTNKQFIWGRIELGVPKDSARVRIENIIATDGGTLPDGAKVVFITTKGTFANGTTTTSDTTMHGIAAAYLRSVDVLNRIDSAVVRATIGTAPDTISREMKIYMYPGAVTGLVRKMNAATGALSPIQGAIAEVVDTLDRLIGKDITKADGAFFVALQQKDTIPYYLRITARDSSGALDSMQIKVPPDKFFSGEYKILNAFSGRLRYSNPIEHARIPGVLIRLTKISGATGSLRTRTMRGGVRLNVDSVYTDDEGRFKFRDLEPAIYELSAEGSGISGKILLADTASGVFAIDMNIDAPRKVGAIITAELVNDSTGSVYTDTSTQFKAGTNVRVRLIADNSMAGTKLLRNIVIVDSIFGAAYSTVTLVAPTDTTITRTYPLVLHPDSAIVIHRTLDSLGGFSSGSRMKDTIEYTIGLDPSLISGTRIITRTYLSGQSDSAFSTMIRRDIPLITNTQYGSMLTVIKIGNKKVVEIGDVVTYQLTLIDSGSGPITSIILEDRLPHSFQYYKSSARYRGQPLEPVKFGNNRKLRWTLPDTLRPGIPATIIYQTVVGADALQSDGINTATASGWLYRAPVFSRPAIWQVTVKPGVFTDKGIIIGKVFYDDNRDCYQDEGENGVKGIELWMEDGTRITTGDDGKYSLPEVKPGQHVLRVNERTLPSGTTLLVGTHDFAGDASTRFVRLTEGGIKRADFYLKRQLHDTLKQYISKITRAAFQKYFAPQNILVKEGNGKQDTRPGDVITSSVRLNYSGSQWLQRIVLFETLSDEFVYVEGSATFNNRKVDPQINGSSFVWNLGRSGYVFDATLEYSLRVKPDHYQDVKRTLTSSFELMSQDSIVMVTDTLQVNVMLNSIPFTEEIAAIPMDFFPLGRMTLLNDAIEGFNQIADVIYRFRDADILIVVYPDIAPSDQLSEDALRLLAEQRVKIMKEYLFRRVSSADTGRVSIASIYESDPGWQYRTNGDQDKVSQIVVKIHTYFTSDVAGKEGGEIEMISKSTRIDPPLGILRSDSIVVAPGDEVVVRYELFANPLAKAIEANIIDTLDPLLAIVPPSARMNEIPLAFADRSYQQVAMNILPVLRSGKNVGEFSIKTNPESNGATIANRISYRRKDGFGDVATVTSNNSRVLVRGRALPLLDRTKADTLKSRQKPKIAPTLALPSPRDTVRDKMLEILRKLESKKEVGKALVLPDINFTAGTAQLTPESEDILAQLVDVLKLNTTIEFQILGHTDNAGSKATNTKLSSQRAESVKQFFVNRGIDPKRMTTKGYGPTKPIAPNTTPDGQAKNRRVEFVRVK